MKSNSVYICRYIRLRILSFASIICIISCDYPIKIYDLAIYTILGTMLRSRWLKTFE